MTDDPRNPARVEALRASRRALIGMAPLVPLGLLVGGLAVFLKEDGRLLRQFSPAGQGWVTGAIAFLGLGGLTLAGWVIGRLAVVTAELSDQISEQAESARRTAELIESQVIPALERIAEAATRPPEPALALAETHRATEEEAESRRASIADLRARLDAARRVNDPDGALDLHDELVRLLPEESRPDLDRGVLSWLMTLIQKRLRAGTVRPDVVHLAERVADRFGATTEGAALRASLATLRRSAGLCARCGQPYTGLENACPLCLGAPPTLAFPADPAEPGDPVPLNPDEPPETDKPSPEREWGLQNGERNPLGPPGAGDSPEPGPA